MTPTEAYKIGFQMACAVRGRETEEVAKTAYLRQQTKKANPIYGELKNFGHTAVDLLRTIGWPVALGAAAAPPIAGALGGVVLSNMREPPASTSDIRQEEMLAAYEDAVRRMRQSVQEREDRMRTKTKRRRVI